MKISINAVVFSLGLLLFPKASLGEIVFHCTGEMALTGTNWSVDEMVTITPEDDPLSTDYCTETRCFSLGSATIRLPQFEEKSAELHVDLFLYSHLRDGHWLPKQQYFTLGYNLRDLGTGYVVETSRYYYRINQPDNFYGEWRPHWLQIPEGATINPDDPDFQLARSGGVGDTGFALDISCEVNH